MAELWLWLVVWLAAGFGGGYVVFLVGIVPLNVHYRSKVWGHLEMSIFKEKHCFFFNEDDIKLI